MQNKNCIPLILKAETIDIANIALMIFSCVLAFIVPFELFLFSYAILGPLHYLTEITWLHKRDYFTNGKFDYLWLVLLCIGLFLFNFVFKGNANAATFMLYLGFASALGFILFKDIIWKIAFVLIAAFIGGMMIETEPFFLLFAIFLPTLVHVFLFTALFILFGALKNKSKLGIASLVVFALCAVSFFVWFPTFSFYHISNYAEKTLIENDFALVNVAVFKVFNLGETTRQTIFASDIGFGIMRFIAFAYTYHYLNWFSKTSVIKWHLIPKKWLASVVVLWLSSIALYIYDYKTGLIALFFLSTLHVYLEFPLNYRIMIGIGQELKSLFGFNKLMPAPTINKKK